MLKTRSEVAKACMQSTETAPVFRPTVKAWLQWLAFSVAGWALVFLLAAALGCTHYNPSLYPSYDVLNPGEAVRKNPISSFPDPITGESLFVVTADFIQWVAELKAEVLKLRKGK